MSGDFLSYFPAGARQAAKAKRKGKFWVIYNQFLHWGAQGAFDSTLEPSKQ